MKPLLLSFRWIGCATALFWIALSGIAQPVDGPVGVAVNIKAQSLQWGFTGDGWLDLSITGLNGVQVASAVAFSDETDQITARLEPGKTYFLNINSYDLGDLAVLAVPPPGYVMEIERVARERMILGTGDPTSVRMRVIAPYQEYSGRGGTATMLTSGRVLWQASMGYLANGASAGAIAIIDTGTTTDLADLFTPDALLYEQTSSEVEVIYRPWNDPDYPGTIQQILAPQVCLEIGFDSSTQAQLKFYHRGQLKAVPSSGVREFNGTPFAWYFVNQAGSQVNKIEISCDLRELPDWTTVLTGQQPDYIKRTIIERSGTSPNFTWTADDWYEHTVSVSRDTRTRSGTAETITVAVPSGSTAFSGSRTYVSVPWGEEVQSETRGSTNAITTSRYYNTTSSQAGSYGRPSSTTTSGGRWEAYEYYDYGANTADVAGALNKRHRPFENSNTTVPSNLATHTGEVITYEYGLDAFGRRTRPTSVETAVNGTVTARTTTSYSEASAGFTGHPDLNLVTATRNDSSANGVTLTTVVKFFREDAGTTYNYATDDFFRMQTHSIEHPDGSKQSYVYQRGTWSGSTFTISGNNGTDFGRASRISIINGRVSGGTSYTTHDGYDMEDLHLVEGLSTMDVVIRDEFARIKRTETHVRQSSEWKLLEAVDYGYNYANQITSRSSTNYGTYTAAWEGEHKLWEQDETGVKITFDEYDDASRVKYATREGSGDIAAVTTRYSYDALHRLTEERVGWEVTEQNENLVSSRSFDDAGRLSGETPAGLGTTGYNYSYSTTNSTRTTNLPGGANRVETFHPDGRLKSVTGSAVVESHYDYAIQALGVRYTKVSIGSSTSTRIREAWADWLGRTTKTSRPGWTGQGAFEEQSVFEPGTGRLIKTTATGYAPTRYEYDTAGRLERTGLDIDDDGFTDNSADRITKFAYSLESSAGGWWQRIETKAYPEGSGAEVLLSTSRERLSGHAAGRFHESSVTDAEGNVTTSVYDVDRVGRTASVTITRTGLSNETQSYSNGFLVSVTGVDGLTYTTQYDSLLRASSISDPRIGTTTTAYHSGSTLPSSVTAAAGLLYSCAYDSLGRKTRHTDAAGKNTRYAYNSRGQLEYQWGDGAYPVSYVYDTTYGDRTAMRTYREAPATDSTSWPTVGTIDETGFAYHTATGLLHKKTDDLGRFTEFSYNSRGQTYQRFWARTTGANRVTSTYAYNGNTGELTGVTYNDGTPSVSYEYNRFGQLKKATDATGERTFNYDSGTPWRVASTTLPAFYGSRVITSLYNTTGVIGHPRGFQLGASVNSASDLEQAMGFTVAGSLETLVSKRANNATTRTFRYAYKTSSNLVETMSIDGHSFSTSRGYETNRDLLSSIESKWGTTAITRYDYTYNSLYQRATAKQSGDASAGAFSDYGEPTFHRYSYNARGELTDAPAYLGTTVTDTSRPLPGRQYGFDYDSIGNRKWADRTGNSALREDYVVNDLNQYDSKENHALPVQGTVDSIDTVVAVSGATTATGRQGRFWSQELTVANTSDLWWTNNLKVHSARITPGTGDVAATSTRTAWLAKALQTFAYDNDGNLVHDSVWQYTWDAENRLLSMQHRADVIGATKILDAEARRLEFVYDYLGRRVRKIVRGGWNGTTFAGAAITDTKYLYDGWNLVAEFNALSTLTLARSYTWGLDIASSLVSTGGVGALLQIYDHAAAKTLLAASDGNGNVVALVNADSGVTEAAYEYDPFGQLLRSEGPYAASNPIRFSSKFTDVETGLVYYGHRYYAPGLGRFINRDPLGEAGGLNLYGFAGNDGINSGDYLGLTEWDNWGWGWPWWGWNPWGGDGWWSDWWWFPWDSGQTYSGPEFSGRVAGTVGQLGPRPLTPYASMALNRGNSPYDARRHVYANTAGSGGESMAGLRVDAEGLLVPSIDWGNFRGIDAVDMREVEARHEQEAADYAQLREIERAYRDWRMRAVLHRKQYGDDAEALADYRDYQREELEEFLSMGSPGGLAKVGQRVTIVYRSVSARGVVQYVGITNRLAKRALEHLASKGIQIEKIYKLGALSRADARAVEQALIEIHGLMKNGGTLINKINSIAETNPKYAEAVRRGFEILKKIGYDGQ